MVPGKGTLAIGSSLDLLDRNWGICFSFGNLHYGCSCSAIMFRWVVCVKVTSTWMSGAKAEHCIAT